MTNQTNLAAPFETVGAKQLLDQFTVTQAAQLARAGNYASAESMLKELVQRADAPAEALDLLAKVCVQQGRVLEAGGLWRRALDKEPANAAYQAALARLNRMQQRPIWFTFLWPAILAIAAVILCLAALRIQTRRQRAEFARIGALVKQATDAVVKSGDAAASALLTEIRSLRDNQLALARNQAPFTDQFDNISRLSQSLDALATKLSDAQSQIEQARHNLQTLTAASAEIAQTSSNLLSAWSVHQDSLVHPPVSLKTDAKVAQRASPASVAPAVRSPRLRLDVQIGGVVAIPQDDHWIIRFNEELFDRYDHFRVGSKALLESVAKSLIRSQEPLIVEVIGTAGDGPPAWPWTKPKGRDAISLARAKKVERLLSGLDIFPAGTLRIAARRSRALPLPNDTVVNQSRNRSVVLRVSRAKEQRKSE